MNKNRILWIAFTVLCAVAVSCGDGPNAETPVKTNGAPGTLSYSSTSSGATATTDYRFDGSEGDPISLGNAKQWAANYRDKNPGSIEAHFFGSAIIKQILAESGCVGIRMYYTIDNNGQKQIVLVGATSNGSDLFPATDQFDPSDPNVVADVSWPCPPYCGGGL